jgi:hypothetical protein
VVLGPLVRGEKLQHLGLSRHHQRVTAHRHPAVRDDDHGVQGEPHQQELHPDDPDVEPGKEEQEQV